MSKAAYIEKRKAEKALRESAEGKSLVLIAAALYRAALSDGIVNYHRQMQAQWKALNPAYLARKQRMKLKTRIWERTGATLKALAENAPDDAGKVPRPRVLRWGVNHRRGLAFAQPRAFTTEGVGGSFKPLTNARRQVAILNVLRYGGAISKLESSWKRNGTGSFRDYLSASYGPTRRARSAALRGRMGTPARPLMVWTPEILARAEQDVARAMERVVQMEAGPATA